jgi:hypothetical protein
LSTLALASACGRAGLDVEDGNAGNGGNSNGGGPTTTMVGPGGNGGAGGSGGSGGSCTVAQECADADDCTTDACVGGECQHTLRDDDMDGAVAAQCGGSDCNDFNPNVFPGHPEVCTDGSDNDCNGVADCNDPACVGRQDCGCDPTPENCSNNLDDDCDGIVDCFDADCVGTPACGCLPSEAGLCENGFDDDCDGAFDCDDSDCAGTQTCQCKNQFEDCSNGADDDCNLLVDCADPACAGVFPCACIPPGSPEVCNDGVDNDCDGKNDCADSQCLASPACQNCTAEICNDGIDNDCDQLIDCADSACFLTPTCAAKPEVCNNGLDDDFDGNIDCQDSDCATNPLCQTQHANCLSPLLVTTGTYTGDTTGHPNETKGSCGGDAGEAVFYFVLDDPSFVHLDSAGSSFDSVLYVRTGACNSGKEIDCDDDSGATMNAAELEFTILYPGTYYVFLDGYTVDPQGGPNEGPYTLNVDIIANPPEVCGDGIDNDGDVYVDCADPDCATVAGCLNCNGGQPPEPEFGPGRCTDGEDNDCDGKVDCGDSDCHASDIYVTECCNGADQNGNGIVDDFSCRCANDSECGELGQVCYTHTLKTCGPPCDQFFGDVCPNVQPGSFCNATTQQCEFP